MKVFIITDCDGNMISAWPKIGVAKIHCRKELNDRIANGCCVQFDIDMMAAQAARALSADVRVKAKLAKKRKAKK